jgi:muconolactone D-isomerase
MKFLVAFVLDIPAGTTRSEISDRETAEAAATAKLADEGHLVRVWRSGVAQGDTTIVGVYRADSDAQLDGLLGALPLADWMHVTVTPLEAHPNDPTVREPAFSNQLPDPRLSLTYRLDAPSPNHSTSATAPKATGASWPSPAEPSRVLSSTGGCSPARAPTGRSSWATAPHSATSATHWRPTAVICCTSNHELSDTAPRKYSHVSAAARRSTPAGTPSAPRRRSRPPPLILTG